MFKVKQLDKLVRAGIISEEQKEQILNFENRKNSGFISRLIALLGVFTIGIGIISIIASNWENIGEMAKLFVMFAALFGCGIGAGICHHKGMFEKCEKLLVVMFLLVAATIGLIIQVYQLSGGKWYTVLAIWFLVTAPLLFVSGKNCVAYFWVPVFLVWCDCLMWDWRGLHGLSAILDPFGYVLYDMGLFAGFALLGKLMVQYLSKQTLGRALLKYSLFAVYLCLALYIIFAWRLTHIYRLIIAAVLLIVSGFVYRHFGAYGLVRRNIKFGGLIVVMFYINLAGNVGLLQSGVGLILSGVGLLFLVKFCSIIMSALAKEKKDA